MALLWIAVGIGILITVALVVKLVKTPRYASVSMNRNCKRCGETIMGERCPRCDNSPDRKKYY